MYSVVLMMAMSHAGDLPGCHRRGGHGCHTPCYTPCYTPCVVVCPPPENGGGGGGGDADWRTGEAAKQLKELKDAYPEEAKAIEEYYKDKDTTKEAWKKYYEEHKPEAPGPEKRTDADAKLLDDLKKLYKDDPDLPAIEKYYKEADTNADWQKFAKDAIKKKKEGGKLEIPDPLRPAPATIVVTIPEGARLRIDGKLTKQTTSRRVFESPNLPRGRQYTYSFAAEIIEDGRVIAVSKAVPVRAGAKTHVNLGASVQTASVGR